MKLLLLGFVVVLAAPAAAQNSVGMGAGTGGVVGGILTPPPAGNPLWGGLYNFDTRYDDVTSRIDRRNSARYRAAKLARKARERAEREARRAATEG